MWAQASSNYLYNFFFGPFSADVNFLSSVKSLAEQEKVFVSVSGEKSLATGMQQISQTKSKATGKITKEEVKSDYIILVVDQRFLLVKADHGHESDTSFTGSLELIPGNVYNAVIQDLEKDRPGIKSLFFPFMLDAGNFRLGGYFGLVIGIPLFFLGLWNIKKALQRTSDLKSSPIVKAISRHGEPFSVGAELDSQVKESLQKFGKKCFLTKNWFVNKKFFDLNVARFDRIAWVYKKVTKHSVNFIPTGKTYGILVNTQFGDMFEVEMTEKEVNGFLEKLATSAPWIVFGYSDELKALWDKDKAGFVGAVEERKKKVQQATSS